MFIALNGHSFQNPLASLVYSNEYPQDIIFMDLQQQTKFNKL